MSDASNAVGRVGESVQLQDSISHHDVILKSITAPKSGISKLQSESFGFCETESLHYWIFVKLN